jgi:23S rRNA (adenine2503-C2)-methyltransferase
MRRVNLRNLDLGQVAEVFAELGLPAYRARQLIHWVYDRGAESLDEISEFSKPLRLSLGEVFSLEGLPLKHRMVSRDGTEKYLFGLEDETSVESVLIPDGERVTVCVSSQVGCGMGCLFCRTGREGFVRNLNAYEIVEQVSAVQKRIAPRRITNVVFMGMGEPLKNLREVEHALWRLENLLKISKRRITISTAGLVPGLRELSERVIGVNLAVSLNATTDKARSSLMPINARYPIRTLLEACRRYPLPKRSRITIEYILIKRVNDSLQDALRLASLLRGIPSKINLIPLNEFEGCSLRRPSDVKVVEFQEVLLEKGMTALIRKSRGEDILAACGQLSSRSQRAGAEGEGRASETTGLK